MLLAFSNLFTRHWCGSITASCFRGIYNKFVAELREDVMLHIAQVLSAEGYEVKPRLGVYEVIRIRW